MAERNWFWATLTLSSVTVLLFVFAGWELMENHLFRDADYVTLHYLYVSRGIASSVVLGAWAAWFVWREKRASEENLRKSQERYRGLLEAVPGAVVLFDASLNVIEWNASAERLYGRPRADVIGRVLSTVPESRRAYLDEQLERVKGGVAVLEVETTRQPWNGGEEFPVQLSLLPYHEPGAGQQLFLEVTYDIRDRVRWRRQMLEIEKLTSMGKMAAGTAHHLNSPLAALLLRIQMLREEPEHAPAGELEKIEQGLRFCQHFVQQLLEFTRTKTASQRREHDVAGMVESVASFFSPMARARGAKLTVDASEGRGLAVLGDRNQLETVMLVLLTNALDAVETGSGKIEIYCAARPGGTVAITVKDNGTGISEANLAHVFEPFFTTKESGKGTGLGLAIASNVLVEHGGAIRIESELGQGTRVAISLPLARKVTDRAAVAVEPVLNKYEATR